MILTGRERYNSLVLHSDTVDNYATMNAEVSENKQGGWRERIQADFIMTQTELVKGRI